MARDVLGWECFEGCDCKEKNHVHYNNMPPRPTNKNWLQQLLNL
jgi:hypothetical protein